MLALTKEAAVAVETIVTPGGSRGRGHADYQRRGRQQRDRAGA